MRSRCASSVNIPATGLACLPTASQSGAAMVETLTDDVETADALMEIVHASFGR